MVAPGAIRAGRAFVEIFADDRLLTRGLKRAQARLRAFANQVGAVGQSLTKLAAGVAVPVGVATKVFVSLSDQLLTVKAITGATGAEFEKLSEKAKELGRTTSFTASEVAAAQVELARAGFDVGEIDASIAGVLDLARATGTELPLATQIAGSALRGFGLEAGEIGRVVDVLTIGANKSAQTLTDLGESVKFVAPLASTAGESIEDVTKAIGVLANNGIRGTVAGTALARAFKNLSKESTQVKLAKLGVEAADAAGDLRPIADIIGEIGEAVSDLGTAEQLATFEEIFGRASAAASKLAAPGASFKVLNAEIDDAGGKAAKLARVMDSGLGGAFRRLLSAVEGIAIAVGESLADAFSSIADVLAKVSGQVTKFIEQNRELINTIVTVAAVVGGVGIALITAAVAMKGLALAITPVVVVFKLLNLVMITTKALMLALLSPIGLVVAAVAALAVTFTDVETKVTESISTLRKNFDNLKSNTIRAFGAIAKALAAGEIDKAMQVLWQSLRLIWAEGVAFLKTQWFKGLSTIAQFFAESVAGFQAIWENVMNFLVKAWFQTIGALKRGWANFTSFWQGTFEKASSAVADGIIQAQGLLEGASAKEIGQRRRLNRQQRDRNLQGIEERRRRAIDAASKEETARLTQLEKQHRENLVQISKNLQTKLKQISDEQSGDTAEIRRNLAKARQEWLDAVKAAENAATAVKGGADELANKGGGGSGSPGETFKGDTRKRIEGIPVGPAAGAFQAAAAFRLAQQSANRVNEEANKKTAKNTQVIAELLEQIDLQFRP